MKRIMVSWIVCVLALVALFAWFGAPSNAPEDESDALIHAAFTLTTPEGRTVTEKDFRGQYLLIYFGYTHCPSICPTSLLLMQNVLGHLGGQAKTIQPLFISLDPERDTPKIVGNYVAHFGSGIMGLTGTPEQIATAADNFKIYFSRVEEKDSALGYTIDHSGFLYLIGPDGKYITHFPYNISERELEESMRHYVR